MQSFAAIVEYKKLLRQKIINFPRMDSLRMTYDAIDLDVEINGLVNIKDLATDVVALEQQFYELNDKTDVLLFYSNLLQRIERFANESNEQKVSESEQQVLSLLYAHTLTKIASLNDGKNSNLLIIDIERYFKMVLNNIQEVAHLGAVAIVNRDRKQYVDAIDAKIIEYVAFLRNEIQNEIENLFQDVQIEMQSLIDDISTMETKTLATIKARNHKLQRLQQNVGTNYLTGLLNVVQMLLGDFAAIGKTIIDVTEHMGSTGHGVAHNKPMDVLNRNVLEYMNTNDLEKLHAIEMELNKLTNATRINQHGASEKLEILLLKTQKLISLAPSQIIHEQSDNLIIELKQEIDRLLNDSSRDNSPTDERLRNVSSALNVIDAMPSMYRTFFTNNLKMDTINAAMDSDKQKLRKLSKIETSIYSDLLPAFNDLHSYLKGIVDGKPSMAMRFQQLNARQKLQNVQRQLTKIAREFQLVSNAAVKNCIAKIHETIDMIVSIYQQIENYESHSNLIGHLTKLRTNDFRRMFVNDAQLSEIMNELQFSLKSNVLLRQYDQVIDAVKQAVFPFAADYIGAHHLSLADVKASDTNVILNRVINGIKTLSERVRAFNTTAINSNDALIHISQFNTGTKPFYKWSNGEIHNQIRQLFNGEKIYLFADVLRSDRINAVKFRQIDIVFRVANETLAARLANILPSFSVAMTHMGNSHYRCGRQIYSIMTSPQKISYSLQQQANAPAIRNVVYDKLNSGNALLSPYALWGVQLSRGQFEHLLPFVDVVDIELHGVGTFVDEHAPVCDTDLRKYY